MVIMGKRFSSGGKQIFLTRMKIFGSLNMYLNLGSAERLGMLVLLALIIIKLVLKGLN